MNIFLRLMYIKKLNYRLTTELRVSVYGRIPVHSHVHANVHAHAGELMLLDLLLLVAAERRPARLIPKRRTAIVD